MKLWKKRFAALGLLTALLLQLCACGSGAQTQTSKTLFVLDTSCTITLYGGAETENETLLAGAFDLCTKYENLLSTTLETSDIYKLNHRETSTVSAETAALIQKGLDYGAKTDGAFDITIEPLTTLWNFDSETHVVPADADIAAARARVNYKNVTVSGTTVTFADETTQLDLGGIAKGYIADEVAAYLRDNGAVHALVNLGGNVLCVGGKTDTEDFTVGIEKPFETTSIAAVQAKDLSVVTSGVYQRYYYVGDRLYHHILDPNTGYPYNNGLLSVSIIGPDSCECDALSTSCFALGLDGGLALINGVDGYYAVFITSDYQIHFSEGAETALKFQY